LAEIQRSKTHYNANNLYDKTVSRLFKSRLHQEDEYCITFAKRGNSDRTKALDQALQQARLRALASWGVSSNAPIHIKAVNAASDAALQVADYLLWALQRLYERREDRYINYVWPVYHLVRDVDDTRVKKYGVYFTQKNPISIGKLKPLDAPEI